jgi:hypothetical protein
LGDQLVEVGTRINWEAFSAKLKLLIDNKSEIGGRPNIDVVVMLKSLYIQNLYSLSDEQLESELADRISFRVFLGTTEAIPDSTTIWKFKERLANNGKDIEIWNDLQKQLDAMNLKSRWTSSRMLPSSHPIQATPKKMLLAEMRQKPDVAEMDLGPRKVPNRISDINYTVQWILNLG